MIQAALSDSVDLLKKLQAENDSLRAHNCELIERLIDRTSAMLRHETAMLKLVRLARRAAVISTGFIKCSDRMPVEEDGHPDTGEVLVIDGEGLYWLVTWEEVPESFIGAVAWMAIPVYDKEEAS